MFTTKFNSHPAATAKSINPFGELIFRDFMNHPTRVNNYVPAVNVKESTDKYQIELAAPGREKSDFAITVDKDSLTISTEKKTENLETSEKFTRKEFSFASFKRTFSLPELVDIENITASYEHGILRIALPKKEVAAASGAKQITIA